MSAKGRSSLWRRTFRAVLLVSAVGIAIGLLSLLIPTKERLNRELYAAVGDGDLQLVQTLLNRGADANALPLQEEAGSTVTQLINSLLGRQTQGLLSTTLNPLMLASQRGYTYIVRALLEHGADPRATIPVNLTPLHFAAESGANDVADLLLANGAQINAVEGGGNTPLMIAIACGKSRLAIHLLDMGADIGPKAHDGSDAHSLALRLGDSATLSRIKSLMRHGD